LGKRTEAKAKFEVEVKAKKEVCHWTGSARLDLRPRYQRTQANLKTSSAGLGQVGCHG